MAVPGYVFWPDDRHSGTPPAGFGLFRAIDTGYELWLAGLDLGVAAAGTDASLLAALFATPQGQKTWVVRMQRGSRYAHALAHLLADFGFVLGGRYRPPALVPAHRARRRSSPRACATRWMRAAR